MIEKNSVYLKNCLEMPHFSTIKKSNEEKLNTGELKKLSSDMKHLYGISKRIFMKTSN